MKGKQWMWKEARRKKSDDEVEVEAEEEVRELAGF